MAPLSWAARSHTVVSCATGLVASTYWEAVAGVAEVVVVVAAEEEETHLASSACRWTLNFWKIEENV